MAAPGAYHDVVDGARPPDAPTRAGLPPAPGALSRGARRLRRAPPAPRDGARPQGRPRRGRRAACGAGRRRARARPPDADRGHRRRRRRRAAPYELARRLAADAWGARQTWFLTNGASQGNVAACLAIAPARRSRRRAAHRPRAARSTGWSWRGCAPPSSRPRSTPSWASRTASCPPRWTRRSPPRPARPRRSSSHRRTSAPWPTSAAWRASPTRTACR